MTEPQVHQCARCGRPMRHDTALIDTACAAMLRRHLGTVARIAGDITLTVARLDEINRTGPGRPDDLGWWKTGDALEAIRLPPRFEAAERHDAAAGELTTWARLIAEERGLTIYRYAVSPTGSVFVDHPLRRAALFVAFHLEWLRHRPNADEAWPALLTACGELVRVVDRQAEGNLVGMCHCGMAVYSDQTGPCRRCGEAVDMSQTREQLIAAMGERTVTASEAAKWVATLGFVTDAAKLRKLIWAWADRGHLAPLDDTPRYRFGDVLNRVMQSPALLRAA